MIEFIQQQLVSNEFLQGGMIVGVFWAILSFVNRYIIYLWYFIRRRILIITTIENYEPNYRRVLEWTKKHLNNKIRIFNIISDNRKMPVLTVGYGRHFFRIGHHFFFIDRDKQQDAKHNVEGYVGLLKKNITPESITITTFFYSKKYMSDLLATLKKQIEYENQEDETTKIYIIDKDGYTADSIKTPSRPLDSIILPKELKQDIIQDLKWFINHEEWYNNCGIPYHRGYLLHGPPGNGKSSLCSVLASHFNIPIKFLQLNNEKLSDSDIISFLSYDISAKHSILLIEDIDSVFNGRKLVNDKLQISFSGLINAIDGVTCPHGNVLIVTTNYPDTLDPALIRCGRIDKKYKIGKPNFSSIKAIGLKILVDIDISEEKFQQLCKNLNEQNFNMSRIQEQFLQVRSEYA